MKLSNLKFLFSLVFVAFLSLSFTSLPNTEEAQVKTEKAEKEIQPVTTEMLAISGAWTEIERRGDD